MEGAVGGMTPRPRLLFLCQTLPYPPDGGVWIRTYHILRLLARAFDITALCFERAPMAGNDAARDPRAGIEALSPFARVEVFPIPQRRSRTRFVWDHMRSMALQRVYTTFMYESRDFAQRLSQLRRESAFDLVHVDSLDLAAHLPACDGIPIVCVHHDVTSTQLQRRAGIERTEWRRAYLRHQARLMARAERDWCARVAMNVVVSADDGESLRAIAPGARVTVVPNGVDVDQFRPASNAGRGAAYVGGLHWFPNADALEYFAADILPHLRRADPEMPIRWIGSATSGEQHQYRERHAIDVTGYVDDVRPFMEAAACHIVPLRAGGGTRLKILNSWAMGKPVVSTTIGCEGLEAVDGDNILVRDDPKEFADAVLAVMNDRALARRLGASGRATAERTYSWDVIGNELIASYLDIANVDSRTGARIAV
ncbi:MAG TPA: glycosyltransferase family 4 protein [Vicinamibacterales bacterium]|nr:glycosyltransferase family 4 protein [Vicinamibacterales bacterium]